MKYYIYFKTYIFQYTLQQLPKTIDRIIVILKHNMMRLSYLTLNFIVRDFVLIAKPVSVHKANIQNMDLTFSAVMSERQSGEVFAALSHACISGTALLITWVFHSTARKSSVRSALHLAFLMNTK